MRLVDADNARECFGGDGVTGAVMQRMFDSLPTIDAVPVVRCRDCKWFNHYTMECESDDVATDHEGGASFSINFGPDDFCSYGQRKEADHDKSGACGEHSLRRRAHANSAEMANPEERRRAVWRTDTSARSATAVCRRSPPPTLPQARRGTAPLRRATT